MRTDMTRSIVVDVLRMAWFKHHAASAPGRSFTAIAAANTLVKAFREALKIRLVASVGEMEFEGKVKPGF